MTEEESSTDAHSLHSNAGERASASAPPSVTPTQVQQSLFTLVPGRVDSASQLAIPPSSLSFFAKYMRCQSYGCLSVLRAFLAHYRSKFCPPASYNERTRASHTIIDATPHVGFTAIALIKHVREFHKIIACQSDPELQESLTSNVRQYGLSSHIFVKPKSFIEYFDSEYGDALSKFAVVHWDTSIPCHWRSSTVTLTMTEDKKDFKLSTSITMVDRQHDRLSSVISGLLNHPTHSVPMMSFIVPIDFDSLMFESLAANHATETHTIKQFHRKILVLAGGKDADTGSVSDSKPQPKPVAVNPYGTDSQVVLASSHRQLRYLYDCKDSCTHSHLYQRLKQILASQLWGKYQAQEQLWHYYNTLMHDSTITDDEAIYDALRDYFFATILNRADCADIKAKKVKAVGCCSDNESGGEDGRANSRVKEIVDIIKAHRWPANSGMSFPIDSMIDIGCSEGSITAALGAALSLPPSHIHGCDVRSLTNTQSFTFTLIIDESLPYPSSSAQLVLALMSLHHIPTALTSLTEIARVLKLGGLLLIREHDCNIAELATLIDVMHGLYARTWNEPPEQPEFCDEFYAHYRPRAQWTSMIESVGLRHCSDSPALRPQMWDRGIQNDRKGFIKNPFQFYYALYEKPADNQQSVTVKRGRDDGGDSENAKRACVGLDSHG